MARQIILGKVVGPKGERGTRWYYGQGLTGDSVNQGSLNNEVLDVEPVIVGDLYFNPQTGQVFNCVVAGDSINSKWTYLGIIKGVKGDALTYSDLTVQQKQELKGQKGDRGQAFKFDGYGTYDYMLTLVLEDESSSSSENQLAVLYKGYAFLVTSGINAGMAYIYDGSSWSSSFAFKGDKGDTGVGIESITTSIQSSSSDSESQEINIISINLSDGTTQSFQVKNGKKGDKGDALKYSDLTDEQKLQLSAPYISYATQQSSVQDNGINTITLHLSNNTQAGSFTIRNGSKGKPGNLWYCGIALSQQGINLSLNVNQMNISSSSSDDESTFYFYIGDCYLNTSNSNFYQCVVEGNEENSKWDCIGNIKGIQGQKGQAGMTFVAGAVGSLNDRDNYDDKQPNFGYLDVDNGNLYIKNSQGGWYGPIKWRGQSGQKGDNGGVFVPHISDSGILSWTNSAEMINPSSVNLRSAATNIVCSRIPPANPYNGLVWVNVDESTSNFGVNALNVVISNSQPSSPSNGDIWIKS